MKTGAGKLAVGLVLVLVLVSLMNCGSARRSDPTGTPPAVTTESLRTGQTAFMMHCHQCHPGGDAGLGPALNNKPLPGFMIRMQIRNGLGAMPSFPEKKMDDATVDAVIEYVRALRKG